MIVSIIVAMGRNRAIGNQGALPWRLPADLARFKQITLGHHLVMGRKTYESIGKPLPGRTTIIITRQSDYQAAGSLVVHSLAAALDLARERGEMEVMVCGGAEIYAQALPLTDRIYLTEVEAEPEADTFFPETGGEWNETEEDFTQADERNQYAARFLLLSRTQPNELGSSGRGG